MPAHVIIAPFEPGGAARTAPAGACPSSTAEDDRFAFGASGVNYASAGWED